MSSEGGGEAHPPERLSPELLAELAGGATPERVQLARGLLEAVRRVAPELEPAPAGGPYAAEVARGEAAIDPLFGEYEQASSDEHRLGVLQALYFIARGGAGFTRAHVERLRGLLAGATSPALATAAGNLLALAGDRDFLSAQLDALHRGDRHAQRAAAQFLGLGRFEAALPRLLALLEPGHASVRAAVLWGLGELGSDEAVTPLLRMLGAGAFVPEVAEALGKIGSPAALPALTDVLVRGTQEQARAAARAISRVTAACGGRLPDPVLAEELRAALRSTLARGEDPLTGLFALAAFARLGGRPTEGELRQALGSALSTEGASQAQALFGP